MTLPVPQEITLRILSEYNEYTECYGKLHPYLFQLPPNQYTNTARTARQVCSLWRALVDLPSSWQFRVTFVDLGLYGAGEFGGRHFPERLTEFNRATLAASQSRVQDSKAMIVAVIRVNSLKGADSEDYSMGTSIAGGSILTEFYQTIANIPSYQSRLIRLEGNTDVNAQAMALLHHIGRFGPSNTLSHFHLEYRGDHLPFDNESDSDAIGTAFAQLTALRSVSVRSPSGWGVLSKLSAPQTCNLSSVTLKGAPWKQVYALLAQCRKSLRNLTLERVAPPEEENPLHNQDYASPEKTSWGKDGNQSKILMESLLSLEVTDNKCVIWDIVALFMMLDCPKLESARFPACNWNNGNQSHDHISNGDWRGSCHLPSLRNLIIRGYRWLSLTKFLELLAPPAPILSYLNLVYEKEGPSNPPNGISATLLSELKFRSLFVSERVLSLAGQTLNLQEVEALKLRLDPSHEIFWDNSLLEEPLHYHLPKLRSLTLVDAGPFQITNSLVSFCSADCSLRRLEVIDDRTSFVAPYSYGGRQPGANFDAARESRLSSISDSLLTITELATSRARLSDLSKTLFHHCPNVETLVINVPVPGSDRARRTLVNDLQLGEILSMPEVVKDVEDSLLMRHLPTSLDTVALPRLRAVVFEFFDFVGAEPAKAVLQLKDHLTKSDALSTLTEARSEGGGKPLESITLRAYAPNSCPYDESFLHCRSGITLKVEVLDQALPHDTFYRDPVEWK